MKISPFIPRGRFFFVIGVLLILFAGIAGKLFYLHVVHTKKSLAAIDNQRNITSTISARRGNITDTRGNLLASTRSIVALGVDPEVISLDDKTLAKIDEAAKILNIPSSIILEKCVKGTYTRMGVNGEEIRLVRWRKIMEIDMVAYEKIAALKIKGLTGDRKYLRNYPSNGLASHVVGFVNKEGKPVTGIEFLCEEYLKGQDGWIQSEKDARRREIAYFRTRDVSASDGMNVELSIDLIIQEIAQRELEKIVEDYKPESATIIVGDPSTGFISALASYPSFDPNNYNKYPQENLRNRAITDLVEPGSTFKIVPIAAALNESMVTQDDTFDCAPSTALYKGRILNLPKDTHNYGVLSVRQIAEKSSNKGAAHLGMMLGEKKLYEYARLFGYGEKTDLGLMGEIKGVLHKPQNWDGLTITRLPMGHAVSATPMQIHCAMSVLANGGVYMKPQLVKRVLSSDGRNEIVFQPKATHRVVSAKTAATMCDILAGVVGKQGTAQKAALEGFKVAGKTGTTQKIVNGKYSTREHVASFSGFLPADRPQLVVTIVVDSPKSDTIGYGGAVAAPAFAHVAKQVAAYLGIQSEDEMQKIIAWE